MSECSKSVKQAGFQLVKLRRMSEKLEAQAMIAQSALGVAVKDVCSTHGALNMQSGETEVLLHEIASVAGKAKMAHNAVRLVLKECDIDQPSDDEIKEEAKATGEADADILTWR